MRISQRLARLERASALKAAPIGAKEQEWLAYENGTGPFPSSPRPAGYTPDEWASRRRISECFLTQQLLPNLTEEERSYVESLWEAVDMFSDMLVELGLLTEDSEEA